MTEVTEVLVIEDSGEVLQDTVVETIVSTEVEAELIEVAEQGPEGPPGTGTGYYQEGNPLPMQNQSISAAKTISFNGELDHGASGALVTIVLADAQKHRVTLTDPAPTISIDTAGAGVGHYQARIVQDDVGARVPTFQGISPFRWLGSATAPPVNAAANGESLLNLYWDGTNLTQSLTKVGAA